jgi:hypothetical protein
MRTRPTSRRKALPTLRLSSGCHNSPPAAAGLAGSACLAAAVRIPAVRIVPAAVHTVLAAVHTVLVTARRVPGLGRRD